MYGIFIVIKMQCSTNHACIKDCFVFHLRENIIERRQHHSSHEHTTKLKTASFT